VYKAVAWDIDGTLVDSEPLHLRSLLAVCESYSVELSDVPDDSFIGVNLYGVWDALKDRFPANLTRSDWIAQINRHYSDNRSSLVAIPHAGEVVRDLAECGIRQAAASNSNRLVVDVNLMAIGVSDLMEFSLSLDDVERGKPDPLPYLMVAEKFGLRPDEILAIEDSSSGLASARAAGLGIAALCLNGNGHAGADFPMRSLKEVAAIVSEMDAKGFPDCELAVGRRNPPNRDELV
jgi:HAD superfamily hydrolase (TIGR01509 family)